MSTLGLDAISTSKDVQRLWICGKILGGGDRAYIKEIHFRQTERGLKVRLRAYGDYTDRCVVGRGRGCSDGVWTV
eukprot:scaffold73310_cov37-Phaeocystis_antarctica.AAC.1